MALRRVAPDEVQLGMFIQGFDGSWFDHPFWRTRFVLAKESDLALVRDCDVAAVIVDDELGVAPIAVSEPQLERSHIQVPRRPEPLPARRLIASGVQPHTDKAQTFASEYGHATKIFGKSKRAVSAIYSDVRLGKALKAEKLEPLVGEITDSINRNPRAFMSIVQLKSRHEYTHMHSVAVCALMINLARELRFGESAVREAGMAGLLHDVGKALMPVEILDKPGPLTDDEMLTIKTHPQAGRDLLSRSSGVSHNALDVCLRHHERFDGTGYPDGLAGDRLSLFARMSALCDVYDAVTSERCYKRALTPSEAVATMQESAGHFDPEMLDIFVRSVGVYPVGALVRLKSGRAAMVIGDNPDDPTHPPLFSVPDAENPDAARIDMSADEIVGMASAEELKIESWETKRSQLIKRCRA